MKIRLTGPLTIAQYMNEVLTNPVSGYYMGKDVFGTKGDYITSPEISQMFGECLGIWVFNEWTKMGAPKPLQLVELGPGRGTLMSDILRTLSKLTGEESDDSISVHFVEVSPYLRKIQEQKLEIYNRKKPDRIIENADHSVVSKFGYPVYWYSSLDSVPLGFSFFIAHEFFDALPIHKFENIRSTEKDEGGWREILIDIVNENELKLRYVRSRHPTPACAYIDEDRKNSKRIEICPQAGTLAANLTKRIAQRGGAALIVDYGHDGEPDVDSFRAFSKHEMVDPLVNPGHADLTADVDFSFIRRHCSKDTALTYGPVTQNEMLRSLGIEIRAEKLSEKSTSEETRKEISSAYDTLTNPDKMGSRFKFFSIFPKTMEQIHSEYPPVGFEKKES